MGSNGDTDMQKVPYIADISVSVLDKRYRNAVAAVLRAYGNIFFFLKYILRRKQHHFIKLTPSDHQKVFRSMLTNGDKNVLIYALVRVNLSGYII